MGRCWSWPKSVQGFVAGLLEGLFYAGTSFKEVEETVGAPNFIKSPQQYTEVPSQHSEVERATAE